MLDLWETGGFDLFFLLESRPQSFSYQIQPGILSWFSQIVIINIQISYLTFICLGKA